MDGIFKTELDELRAEGRTLGEVGCLATHPFRRSGAQNVVMHGNKMVFNYAMDTLGLGGLASALSLARPKRNSVPSRPEPGNMEDPFHDLTGACHVQRIWRPFQGINLW